MECVVAAMATAAINHVTRRYRMRSPLQLVVDSFLSARVSALGPCLLDRQDISGEAPDFLELHDDVSSGRGKRAARGDDHVRAVELRLAGFGDPLGRLHVDLAPIELIHGGDRLLPDARVQNGDVGWRLLDLDLAWERDVG